MSDNHFTPYQVRHLAMTLKGVQEHMIADHYRMVVEEFADMLAVNTPRFDSRNFMTLAGIEFTPGEGMVAKMPIKQNPTNYFHGGN
jgi:hypothetical protein